MVETLIDAGVDVTLRSTATGRAALHHAAGNGQDDATRALLQKVADKDVRTNTGTTQQLEADSASSRLC